MPGNLNESKKLIVALDVPSLIEAEGLINRLIIKVKIFKIGLGLFSLYGPEAVKLVQQRGGRVFLDLKFHDIPNTVAHAVTSAMKLGVFMINVHTLGGSEMMKRVAEAVADKPLRPMVLGVTILTSMDQTAINEVGLQRNLGEEVLNLADMAKNSGLDGVVASSQETAMIRQKLGSDFIIVTPGIRPCWAMGNNNDDQKRIMTPRKAVEAGADYIVVGRPIIEASDPLKAATEIIEEMGN
ncbi:MAG: orotidine-5'-phosphate decarboxylase [Candidatus Omnitrophota bacterium]